MPPRTTRIYALITPPSEAFDNTVIFTRFQLHSAAYLRRRLSGRCEWACWRRRFRQCRDRILVANTVPMPSFSPPITTVERHCRAVSGRLLYSSRIGDDNTPLTFSGADDCRMLDTLMMKEPI